MLSLNYPSAAKSHVNYIDNTSSRSESSGGSKGSKKTVKTYTYTKHTTTEEFSSAEKNFIGPRINPSYSQATTVPPPYTPDRDVPAAYEKSFATQPGDELVVELFVEPPTEAEVIDLVVPDKSPSYEPGEPFASDKPVDIVVDGEILYAPRDLCLKRSGTCGFGPTTPSGKPPPKKKTDTCPSDEKKSYRKESASLTAAAISFDKENAERSYQAAAPYAVHSNAGATMHATSKRVPFRKDKTTGLQAFDSYVNRKTPKTIQSVIAPDSKNKISLRAPDSPILLFKEEEEVVVDEVNSDKPTNKKGWRLKAAAYKDAASFKHVMKPKKADVLATRVANAARKVARAVDKEAEDVHGDILQDIRVGLFDAERAKAIVDGYGADPN